MTYVTEQTSEELRAHMRRLQAMPGWHHPLDDRLYREVLAQDAEIERLRTSLAAAQAERPAGFVLVPVEPTPEMCKAGEVCWGDPDSGPWATYERMLAAAAPSGGQQK